MADGGDFLVCPALQCIFNFLVELPAAVALACSDHRNSRRTLAKTGSNPHPKPDPWPPVILLTLL